MKNLLTTLLIFSSFVAFADFGYFATAAYVTSSGSGSFYNMTATSGDNAIGSNTYQGTNFGTYSQNSGSLTLNGGEMKTWKSGSSNVVNVIMYYTVYPQGARPASPTFTALDISWYQNCSGSTFPSGGPCGGNDQKWQKINYSIDLTTQPIGTHMLEIYWREEGDNNGDGTSGEYVYDNNGSNATNYTAQFTISTPLPIILDQWRVSQTKNGNQLEWSTKSEVNASHFTIESSANGQDFNAITEITASGTSNTYHFLDQNSKGSTYYRLKMVDYDGSFIMSNIIKSWHSSSAIKATYKWPNDIEIQSNTNGIFFIYDGIGKLHKQITFEEGTIQIPLDDLASGLYYGISNLDGTPLKIVIP